MIIPKKKYPQSTDRNLIKRRIRAALEPLKKESVPCTITVRLHDLPVSAPYAVYKEMGEKVLSVCAGARLGNE